MILLSGMARVNNQLELTLNLQSSSTFHQCAVSNAALPSETPAMTTLVHHTKESRDKNFQANRICHHNSNWLRSSCSKPR